jgi:hypothetical protein
MLKLFESVQSIEYTMKIAVSLLVLIIVLIMLLFAFCFAGFQWGQPIISWGKRTNGFQATNSPGDDERQY